ncbi:hypothetical protein GTY20_09070 [Streptomyces sp. SID4946]|uniref:hypothetical protein n=1 Tax=Streptomyces sp. LamerLS-31b TaxID=1839765 RepID=UPI00081E0DF9|nr:MULTISPECIES: hypothetical protein [unclassified Streptomyces]MYQ91468.1 hypothetical protein [Streptomyces sp. SID4946]SCF67733.1 hypothetical protein GA0115256_111318 [Streptomyces sp. DconLS]SCF79488.1 hypothetical protein GA0115258_112581 [Streptomyces sp. LamerLS-31b]
MTSEGKPRALDVAELTAPGDVPEAGVVEMAHRRQRHQDRIAGTVRGLPPEETVTADGSDAIAALVLGTAITVQIGDEQPPLMRQALAHGRTWDEIATAAGLTAEQARAAYTAWAERLEEPDRTEALRLAG